MQVPGPREVRGDAHIALPIAALTPCPSINYNSLLMKFYHWDLKLRNLNI